MAWNKVFTAIKGAISEAGEAVEEKNALRIMDQEIREAGTELDKAKGELTKIMAKRAGAERNVKDLEKKIAEHEGFATQALDKNDEKLARDICERIGQFEEQLATEKGLLDAFAKSETTLKANLKSAESKLRQLKQQQDVIKATEAVQNAQGVVASRFSGSSSKMGSALTSLDRIKKRQEERADRLNAAAELDGEATGDDLSQRMKEAGIGQQAASSDDILNRIKAKK